MSAHTRGPWVDAEMYETTIGTCAVRSASGELIAETFAQKGDREEQANARLIAAAPDLLTATRFIRDDIAWCLDNGEADAMDQRLHTWGSILQSVIDAAEIGTRRCRVCGCTDLHGCEDGCWWVEDDLCSNCADRAEASP